MLNAINREGRMTETERVEIEVAFADVPESTSLGRLDDGEWSQVSNRWARGIDWCVTKLGRHWVIGETFGTGWPLFRTKASAYEAVTALVLTESKIRTRRRLLADSLMAPDHEQHEIRC
jgi:hypothetical protein